MLCSLWSPEPLDHHSRRSPLAGAAWGVLVRPGLQSHDSNWAGWGGIYGADTVRAFCVVLPIPLSVPLGWQASGTFPAAFPRSMFGVLSL